MPHYSVKAVYEKLAGTRPHVNWDKLVWNRHNIPRHRFICWMTVQARLQTTAKLARVGVSASALCLLCGHQDEDHEHLFFSCPYSCQCIEGIKAWLWFHTYSLDLQQLIRGIGHSRQSKFKKQVWYAGLSATVYFVWRCRNSSFWDSFIPTVQSTINRIKQIVRDRILVVMPKKVGRKDSSWFVAL